MARRKSPAAAQTFAPTMPSVSSPPLRGMRLPPFSGNDHHCTKCGNNDATTMYQNAGQTCTHSHNDGFRHVWGLERLHRTCRRCSFSWDEACVAPLNDRPTLVMPAVKG